MRLRPIPTLPFLILLCGLAANASAQEQPPAQGARTIEAPTLPPTSVTGDAVEPDITIIESADRTVFEYRVRGVLYMVKIQPMAGPPYYLLDTDGDGILDQRGDPARDISIPQWVLFSWD